MNTPPVTATCYRPCSPRRWRLFSHQTQPKAAAQAARMPPPTSRGSTAARPVVDATVTAESGVVVALWRAGPEAPEVSEAATAWDETGVLAVAVPVTDAPEAVGPAVPCRVGPAGPPAVGTGAVPAAVISNVDRTSFCPGSSVHDASTAPIAAGPPLAFFGTRCSASRLPM